MLKIYFITIHLENNYLSGFAILVGDALQSLTGKYRGLQGNPCDENRDPVLRTGVPCNENGFFHVRIDLQGVP